MNTFISDNLLWVILSLVVILMVIAATVYSFNKRRYIDGGPRKGEAARPQQVRRQNPPDPHRH